MTPERILMIVDRLARGGAEDQLIAAAIGLRTRGWDVRVCTLAEPGPWAERLIAADVPLKCVGRAYRVDPFAYRRLKKHVFHVRPAIVHTWNFTAGVYGRSAAIACNVPHVIAHEACLTPWKHAYHVWIERYLGRRTELFAAGDAAVIEELVLRGSPRERCRVFPAGVAPIASAAPNERAELLAELGLEPTAKLVGTVGRLVPRKRLRDFIWSQELLKVVHPDSHLLIVGDGPQRYLLERYARQCTMFRDRPHVHFLGERTDIPRILRSLDAYVSTSGAEGHSSSLLEAMSAGVPVVVTNLLAHKKLVRSGVTGLTFSVGDRAGCAAALKELLDQPDLARKLGQAGRELVLRDYSLDRMASGYEEIYRGLME